MTVNSSCTNPLMRMQRSLRISLNHIQKIKEAPLGERSPRCSWRTVATEKPTREFSKPIFNTRLFHDGVGCKS